MILLPVSYTHLDARIHEVRGQRGQIDAAACYRHLLVDGSEIGMSHHNCEKVQDPYSLRCQPQVMGACLTQIRQAAEVLGCEANAVSDLSLIHIFSAERVRQLEKNALKKLKDAMDA